MGRETRLFSGDMNVYCVSGASQIKIQGKNILQRERGFGGVQWRV
jgi:hypothetical protein